MTTIRQKSQKTPSQKVGVVKHIYSDIPPGLATRWRHNRIVWEDPASSAGYSPHRPMPSATESRCARPDRPRRGGGPAGGGTHTHPHNNTPPRGPGGGGGRA